MLPFERLRYLARHAGDDHALVAEAADCLADFEDDPAQLVLVCRRLLAHHPTCGPLWWLCARVVGAADPTAAAEDALRRIARDRTADRLASVLPFPHDEPIAVLGWPETTGRALDQRPDLDVVVVRSRADAQMRRRLGASERTVRMVDETQAMASGCSHLLVEVVAASPAHALVPEGTADLRWSLGEADCWVVVPVDRLLPERMFAVLRGQVTDDDGEWMDLADAAKIAGPGGLEDAARLVGRVECPLAPELLRI